GRGTGVRATVFTPKGLYSTAQGRGSAPWGTGVIPTVFTPKGLYKAFGPVQPLRGKYRDRLARPQGALARPWAVESNPFGVNAAWATSLRRGSRGLMCVSREPLQSEGPMSQS